MYMPMYYASVPGCSICHLRQGRRLSAQTSGVFQLHIDMQHVYAMRGARYGWMGGLL